MDSEWISTGIKELDSLLGKGSGYGSDARGFRRGCVTLVRGEPGSGKTTLVLQILSDYLKSDKNNKAVLFSLEEDSLDLLGRMDRNFHFELASKASREGTSDSQLYCLDATRLIRPIELALFDYRAKAMKAVRKGATLLSVGPVLGFVTERIADEFRKGRISRLVELLKTGTLLIIMDSIDAFMGSVSHGGIGDQPRILLKAVCDFLRSGSAGQKPDKANGQEPSKGNTLLLTGEYHYHAPSPTPAFTESFYCDTEILLRPEPVCVPEDYEQHIQASLGYSLNALIHEEAKSIESRSFCRVLKSRASANQSRRCAYDIVPTKGIQFFETYPGDGKIILFAENEPQRTAWNSFFERDVPDSYPALRHEVFDRMSMQTVYEGQRRLRNIPLKTDMYLSSFDSYWVGWYRSFKLKCDLHNALEPLLKPKPEQHKQYCRFVNSLVHAFRMGMPDIKGASPEEDEREKQAMGVTKKMKNAVDLSKFEELLRLTCSNEDTRDPEKILGDLIRKLLEPSTPFARDYSCFLQRLPFGELRLFGEKRSGILPELIEARKPFRGEEWVKEAKKSCGENTKPSETEWLSVPYDASVGFFVYRKDILHGSRKQFSREKVKDRLWELIVREQKVMRALYEYEKAARTPKSDSESGDSRQRAYGQKKLVDKLKDALPFCSDLPEDEENYNKCVAKVIQWACDRILEGDEPKTWEEIIVQCEMLDKKLLIETQTFDSYMSTLLEMVWNSGGELKVRPDYLIEDKYKLYVPMLRALYLLDTLFDSEIVDRNSTVSPYQSGNRDRRSGDDWLFARHWHSTLITYLTAKDESGRYLATASPGAALEIMPIPVSLSRWADDLYGCKEKEFREQALKCPKPYQFMQKCFPQDQRLGAEVADKSQCPLLGEELGVCPSN
ncbi:MAG TPA: ATPase domain-containing protein [Sedimentisphaerales bacterium]|nr:ATPase domain-containing protein [Sedimentisphaerales bacterium]